MELEPGVRFWLAKQRWLWRAGRLPREEMLLMGYAAVDMDVYGEAEWRAGADAVAAMMAREEARSAGPAAGAATPIAMARWVLTQNALWRQKGLSPPRLAAIREAGLSWVLPDEVLHMGNAQWVRRFQDVADLVQAHGPEGAARRLPGPRPPAAAAAPPTHHTIRRMPLPPAHFRMTDLVALKPWQPLCIGPF